MANQGTATGNIVINTAQFQQAVQQVQRGSEIMNKALAGLGIGVGITAVKQLGEMAFELARDAAQADVTREAFNSLAESFGQNADDMLASMRTSSKGMISDANLVLDANRAMLLGVAQNTEQLTTLLDIARVRGRAMGIDLTKAFDDIVTGLGRMSPRILDNLGIVGGQGALEAYADSVGRTVNDLSDAQKQAILFNHVLSTSKTLLDAAANSGDNAADKFEQFGAKLENSKKQLGDFLLEAGATDSLDTFSTAIDDTITQLHQLDDWFVQLKTDWDNFLGSLGKGTPIPDWFKEAAGWLKAYQDMQQHWGWVLGVNNNDPYANTTTSGPKTPAFGKPAGGHSPVPIPATPIDTKALLAAQVDYNESLAKINRDTNRDIQQATADAGRQRAETVRSYELGIVRDEEDFATSRRRQQRDYEQSIVAIMRDSQAREVKVRADLDENIAQERADSNKQLARQEEDFQTARARALSDHNDDLLDAAGDLDAKRVYELQRDFAKQQKAAQDDRDKALKRDAEDRAEREDRERKAAEKQLSEARAADAQRIQDMRAALDQQRADEDEDRDKRKTRAADDQQHALDQQAIEAGLRIQQIIDNAADERTALQDAFNDQLIALGLHNIAYEKEQKRAQDKMLEDLAPFMKGWYKTNMEALQASILGPKEKWPSLLDPPSFASGGFVPHDMIARLHAGEFVLPARTVNSMTSSNNSRAINIHPGAVVIHAAPGMDEDRLVRKAIDGVLDLMEAA